jgi:hypothetical protein
VPKLSFLGQKFIGALLVKCHHTVIHLAQLGTKTGENDARKELL